MKVTRVLFGIGVGLASGIAVSWMNRDQQRYNANASGQKFYWCSLRIRTRNRNN